ncbi:MAG TPA: chloride channel protein [Myxococcota bacterium]|nr:chloride channel protein [Myxococcota bacterium]
MQRNRRTALWYNYRAYPPELRIHPRLAKSIHSLEALREHEATRLLLAGLFVGLLGGLGAVVFDAVMSGVGELVLGTAFPAREAPVWWRSLLGPTLIGLLVGYLVQKMTHRGRPQGIADVLARVQLDAPSLSFRDGMVSAFTAALAVGSGFSGGREGPIVQFASTLAAKACQILGVRPSSMRTLVAAGAAAGIAASFNTPLGGAFFALEIILGNFAVENFAPVVVATVAGTVLGQALLGDRIALHLPTFSFLSPWELPLYLLLGAVGALVAHVFKRAMVVGAARIAQHAGPLWLRPSLFGLFIGLMSAAGLNEVMGNGYGFMENLLRGESTSAAFLLLLLVCKVLATSVTVAGRTGAGLFAPSLFIGAVTGALFGLGAHQLWPNHTEVVGAYGIVGMGAVAASVLHAPITMALMLFEMTGNYHVILPLMLALAASGVVSVALGSRSLEEMELEKEGLSLHKRRDSGVMHEILVGDIYRADGHETMLVGTPIEEVVRRFLGRRVEEIYVVDADGVYQGTVHIQDVKVALADPEGDHTLQLRQVSTARTRESIADVLPRFFDAPGDGLPVVDDRGGLVGVLAERDVVAAYHRDALRKDARVAHVVSHDKEGKHSDYVELPDGQTMESLTP